MADRFYTPEPLGAGSFVLEGPEAHHLAVVRRFVPGDKVVLFNGDGRDYPALILSADKKHVLLDVHTGVETARELPFRLEVAAALPKGGRGEYLIEKLTELGVTKFTPLWTERSVVQPKDGRMDRLTRAVIESSKQCGRAVLMEVGPPAEWGAFVSADWRPKDRWVLHPNGTSPGLLSNPDRPRREDLLIAVGPEGGFTDLEVDAARLRGWRVVTLGARILRVETAAVAAAAWVGISSLGV